MEALSASMPVRELPGIYDILKPTQGLPDPTAGLSPLQKLMLSMGMETPGKRTIFAVAGATAIVWGLQPASVFDVKTHLPRTFEDGGIPWWVYPSLAALLINVIV